MTVHPYAALIAVAVGILVAVMSALGQLTRQKRIAADQRVAAYAQMAGQSAEQARWELSTVEKRLWEVEDQVSRTDPTTPTTLIGLTSRPLGEGTLIVLNSSIPDGQVCLIPQDPVLYDEYAFLPSQKAVHIGTRPVTDREHAVALAVWTVRDGLADVLAWIGEDPAGPKPVQSGRGQAVYDQLVLQAQAGDL